MLQKKFTNELTLLSVDGEAIDEGVKEHIKGDPATQEQIAAMDLTQEAFDTIQNECCLLSFDLFTRKMLFSMGMEICDEGCHNGFIPFFYCGLSPSLQNWTEHIVKKSNELCPCYKQGCCS